MFQLHLTSWPWDWRWEPGQGSLTLHLAGPLSPHPVSALRSLLSANQFQTLPALTSRPSCPPLKHPQSPTDDLFSEGCDPRVLLGGQ